jgi:phage-related protein
MQRRTSGDAPEAARAEKAIYVLHAFDKTSQRTATHDVDLARQRFRDLLAERRQR